MRKWNRLLLILALAFLGLSAFEPTLIWIAGLLLALVLIRFSLPRFLYRPPEGHLGVIYRWGRFKRWVGPDEWSVVIPWFDEIKPPISLRLRPVEVSLSDLLTQDEVPIECELIIFYQPDLRYASADFRSQALLSQDEDRDRLISTALCETANQVISGIEFQRLLSPTGHSTLKRVLSAQLAARVYNLGLVVDPQTGVSVQALRPADAVRRAMVERFAATALGEAALTRLRPMLEELSQHQPEIAWEALLLEWAAAVAQQGQPPQAVIVSGDRRPGGDTWELERISTIQKN